LRNFVKLLLFLLVVVVISYSGLWFYHASKAKEIIIKTAEQLSGAIIADGGEFSYKNIDVTGFPAAFNVEITGAKITSVNKVSKKKTSLSFEKTLTISSNIAGTRAHIILPPHFDIVTDSGSVGKRAMSISFLTTPILEIDFYQKQPFMWMFTEEFPWKRGNIKRINYRDQGNSIELKDD